LTHLAPGPGNYNPIDNSVWNKIARENADKKGAPATKAKAEDKKDKANDKKKADKPFPGPGQYEFKSEFKYDPKGKAAPKEKKEEKDGKKEKKENN
jgi:hypothetical protein